MAAYNPCSFPRVRYWHPLNADPYHPTAIPEDLLQANICPTIPITDQYMWVNSPYLIFTIGDDIPDTERCYLVSGGDNLSPALGDVLITLCVS